METPLSERTYTKRMKMMLARPEVFMLFDKLGVDSFSTSELLLPKDKLRLRVIRTWPNFYKFSDNPNVSLGINDFFHTCRSALEYDYHKKTGRACK